AAAFFTLFTMAGWMMDQLANAKGDDSLIFRYTVHYSLFGAFWLAWIIATISQIAINDGNYYESVNAGQNLLGSIKRWPRVLTCLLVAGGGVIAADLVNFHFLNGWFKVSSFLAVTVPSATVIMAVDHFVLPRLFRISRPRTRSSCSASASPRSRRTHRVTRSSTSRPRRSPETWWCPLRRGLSAGGARSPQRIGRRRRGTLLPRRRRCVRRPHRRRGRGPRGRRDRRLRAARRRARRGQRPLPLERELVPRHVGQPPARAVDALLVSGARGAGAVAGRGVRPHAHRRHRDAPLRGDLRRRLPVRAPGLYRGGPRRRRSRLP